MQAISAPLYLFSWVGLLSHIEKWLLPPYRVKNGSKERKRPFTLLGLFFHKNTRQWEQYSPSKADMNKQHWVFCKFLFRGALEACLINCSLTPATQTPSWCFLLFYILAWRTGHQKVKWMVSLRECSLQASLHHQVHWPFIFEDQGSKLPYLIQPTWNSLRVFLLSALWDGFALKAGAYKLASLTESDSCNLFSGLGPTLSALFFWTKRS